MNVTRSTVARKALWFYKDEVRDRTIYEAMSQSEKDQSIRDILSKLSSMEEEHAKYWKQFLSRLGVNNIEYRYPAYKLFGIKIIRKLFGLPLLIRIFERGEDTVIREYQRFLMEKGIKGEELAGLQKIVRDEVIHEEYFSNQLVSLKGNLESVRDVFYGMSDGLVEVLAAVAGLEPVVKTSILVAAGGLVVGISGTLSMAIGAYMSTKAHVEIEQRQSERVAREIEMASDEEKVRRMKELLLSMGFEGDYVEDAAKSLVKEKKNAVDFFVRNRLGRSMESNERPGRAGIQTGLFYLIGSAFPILPFAFIGGTVGLISSVIAVALAQTVASIIIAVSSDTGITKKIAETVGLTLGASAATFVLGTLLFYFLHLPAVP
ncbi:MAG: VIT1/CCC1 transporter family protein [Methanomassiliicoccales archaeon]